MNKDPELLKKLIEINNYLDIPSKGFSMFPMIRENNSCIFKKFDLRDLRRGDVLLFITKEGDLAGHRFLRTTERNGQLWFVCKGDTNLNPDEPVPQEYLIGKLSLIKRNGKIIDLDHRFMKIYQFVFSYSHIIPTLFHYYVHKILKKRNGNENEQSSSC